MSEEKQNTLVFHSPVARQIIGDLVYSYKRVYNIQIGELDSGKINMSCPELNTWRLHAESLPKLFNWMAQQQLQADCTDEQIAQWRSKAEKWDKLDERIASCYGDYDESGEWVPNKDHEGPDLGDIGEMAASAFGYL